MSATTDPMTPDVIDISHWNEVTDFRQVHKAGTVGVIHKYSQGLAYRDPKYDANCVNAKAAGLLWGRYHFGTTDDVAIQVENFLSGWQPDELTALDLEMDPETGKCMSLQQAERFVLTVYKETSVYPLIYGSNVLKDYMQSVSSSALSACRLWIAQYSPRVVLPAHFSKYWLWQYSATGAVPGVVGDVDINAFLGSHEMLIDQWAPTPHVTQPLVA